jgi:hypothetical protein
MDRFCESYWQPIYAFARAHGLQEAEAQDATQGFFLRLIEENLVIKADGDKGRLRTFLLTLFKRHLSQNRRSLDTQKRGGMATHVSLDHDESQAHLTENGLVEHHSPEYLFHRRWAISLLGTAIQAVEADWTARGRADVFELLRDHLLEEPNTPTLAAIAAKREIADATVRAWLHRLRLSLHHHLSGAVAQTLDDPSPEAVRAEINLLCRYFSA